MPSTSEKQLNFFRLVNAYKHHPKMKVSKKIKNAAKNMSKKQIKHFLKTQNVETDDNVKYKSPMWKYINVNPRKPQTDNWEFFVDPSGNLYELYKLWDTSTKYSPHSYFAKQWCKQRAISPAFPEDFLVYRQGWVKVLQNGTLVGVPNKKQIMSLQNSGIWMQNWQNTRWYKDAMYQNFNPIITKSLKYIQLLQKRSH